MLPKLRASLPAIVYFLHHPPAGGGYPIWHPRIHIHISAVWSHARLVAQAISVVNLELAPALLSNDKQMKGRIQ